MKKISPSTLKNVRFSLPLSLLLLVVVWLATACATEEVERGNDPWVFRSVLDEKPRMITAALRPDFWVSYDAKQGALYKVFKDGVNFDGPVYTTAHGPQPTSLGMAYQIEPDGNPWSLVQAADTLKPDVQYRGHRFEDGRVSLQYELSIQGHDLITVKESPEYIESEIGFPVLERRFTVSGIPDGMSLYLKSNVASITGPEAISTVPGNVFDITQEMEGSLSGSLALDNDAETVLTIQFLQEPTLVPLTDATPEDLTEHPGRALIETADCQVCHNEQVRTVGPSYLEIAGKYPFTERQVGDLAGKVIRGGTGVWGDMAMTPHPDIPADDVREMVRYILSLDGEALSDDPLDMGVSYPLFADSSRISSEGLIVNAYRFAFDLDDYPELTENDAPVHSNVVPAIHATSDEDFGELDQNFYLEFRGLLNIPEEGNYVFRLACDDGGLLLLDDNPVIDHGGLHGPDPKEAEIFMQGGDHSITLKYFQRGGGKAVSLQWRPPSDDNFSVIPPSAFAYDREDLLDTRPYEPPPVRRIGIPGDGQLLTGLHPGFSIETIRPSDFQPKVGGLDVLPDGRVLVSTWDEVGGVYILDNINTEDPEDIRVKRIAAGLAEPLGLKVVDGDIYVLQKQELTRLIDHDGDEIIDEYRTVSNDWLVSSNFHEFAFGLVYEDGYFYATLATAILPGGASAQPQIPDRGKVMKISRDSGEIEFIGTGLRTPNGIGLGVDNEIFVADNQGDWLPSSKIVHVKEGAFYGSRSVDFDGTADLEVTQPVVWLPQDEIGNSPSQPAPLDVGPYSGQMIHGEVTHGGLKRVFVEKVNGDYQGAVFRFTQGLESGVNRIVWGPDGKLYIGGIGNPGNWGQTGKNWFGLQRLTYTGQPAFEMLTVEARSNGFELSFTEPLRPNDGFNPDDYLVQQWRYEPNEEYGGPKIDLETLSIRSVHVAENRSRVFLEIDGLKPGHVVYFKLLKPWRSAVGRSLWTTEAWYTLNSIPSGKPGFTSSLAPEIVDSNQLTQWEKDQGWALLFDGKSFDGWRGYGKTEVGSDWFIEDGAITADGEVLDWYYTNGGDIITERTYQNFELTLDWKMLPGGNSGVIYLVNEDPAYEYAWETGPEMQILDNDGHGDGRIATHRAGDLYDLIESDFEAAKPPGEWNVAGLVVNNGKVEHWLNGHKIVQYDLNSDDWQNLVAKSKFGEMPGFAKSQTGHLALQDHGNRVWFRNIKIRELPDSPM